MKEVPWVLRAGMFMLIPLLILLLLASCARRGMPLGGPPDVDPPRVVSFHPDSGSVSAGGVSEICVTFNESMERRSVRDFLVLRPHVDVRSVSWNGNTLCLSLADSLQPSATYCVLLMAGYRDAHGNTTRVPHLSIFSPGESLSSGTISGSVTVKGLPSPGTQVWAFDTAACPAPDFSEDEPHYVAQAGPQGDYKFVGLPGGTYRLYAFADKNSNRTYDTGEDFLSPAPGPITLVSSADVVSGLDMKLVNPAEPGGISGVVEHCRPDSLVITVLVTSAGDSLRTAGVALAPDSSFSITDLPSDRYLVKCFVDLNKDGRRDEDETVGCVETHAVTVPPGEVVKDIRLKIECEIEEPPPDGESTR
ncbi:MAG: Ig-like domain-containing protein [Candidatus Eisenbacteria bacterium]